MGKRKGRDGEEEGVGKRDEEGDRVTPTLEAGGRTCFPEQGHQGTPREVGVVILEGSHHEGGTGS